jgi:peptidyl-prolyl cis-trans isomerase SurA
MIFARLIGVLLFCAVMALFSHHLSAQTINRVVAIVNEDVITLHELNKKIREMTGLTPDVLRSRDNKTYLETRQRILDLLINEKITQAKVQELGIQVTPLQVDATIEKIKANNQLTQEDLIAKLREGGLTYEAYREKIKKDMERFRLINSAVQSKIIVREEQLKQYYENHKEEFSSEEIVHLAGIFLKRKNPEDEDEIRELSRKMEDILARLSKGEDFGELAKKFSQGPGAHEKGDLGDFQTAQLEQELRKVLEDMPEGGVSAPIIRPNGIQIVKLIKRQDAKVRPFKEVREIIYMMLYKDEANKSYASWIKELRESSYTKINF